MRKNSSATTMVRPNGLDVEEKQTILKTAFKMILDAQANLMVFTTKGDYQEYLDTRDIELCRF